MRNVSEKSKINNRDDQAREVSKLKRNSLVKRKINSQRRDSFLYRYVKGLRSPKGIVSLIIILGFALLAILSPIIFPQGYDAQSANTLSGLSVAHPFGTDELGRDVLVRTAYGLRADLALIALAVPASAIIGTLMGLSGAVTPMLGNVMQRLVDILVGFPGLVMGITIVVVMGPGFWSLFVALVVSGIVAPARLAYSAWLTQSQREYVQAARVLGVPGWKVMVRHVLPNALDPILVNAATYTVVAISVEAGLSIVGLGIQAPQPSLGALLNNSMRFIYVAPQYMVGPMIVLFLLALGFSLLSDALNEAVNKK